MKHIKFKQLFSHHTGITRNRLDYGRVVYIIQEGLFNVPILLKLRVFTNEELSVSFVILSLFD